MREVEVFVQIDGVDVRAGTAYFSERRGAVSTTVTYDPQYQANSNAYAIDPALPLTHGSSHTTSVPGAFSDCSPDRWGRRLIARAERAAARAERRQPRTVNEIDFLLGISDTARQGALRFRDIGSAQYLSGGAEIPKLIELPALLHAAREADEPGQIRTLLQAGSSALGGARPKAAVLIDDELHTVKFPSRDDDWDVCAWEATALELAERAKIDVPRSRLHRVDEHGVLCLRRFDRKGSRRIGFISAMTLLQARDGDHRDYIEIAEAVARVSNRADADLQELWRRIAFSIAINNTDDHLRNHGLLRAGTSWQLSPVFDVNPNPDAVRERATTIGWATPETEPASLMEIAPEFRVQPHIARRILADVVEAVGTWRTVASKRGISAAEIEMFEPTFAQQHALISEVAAV